LATWNEVTERIAGKVGSLFDRKTLAECFAGYEGPERDRFGQPAKPFVISDIVIAKPKLYNPLITEEETYNTQLIHLYGPAQMPQEIYLELNDDSILERVKCLDSEAYKKKFF